MNRPFNNFESLRKAAIAKAVERTSDIFRKKSEFCFMLISRNGITQYFIFSSQRQAEWRLAELRLYIAADIMRVNLHFVIEEILLRITEGKNHPETCPPVTDWTEWLPKERIGWHDEITPPYYDTDLIVTRVMRRE